MTGLVFAEEKTPQPETNRPRPSLCRLPRRRRLPGPADAAQPKMEDKQAAETPAFRFFGKADDEMTAPTRETAPGPDDSMSIPLFGAEDDGQPP